MTPITHRNREIERLEHELAESREECRWLKLGLLDVAAWIFSYSETSALAKNELFYDLWLRYGYAAAKATGMFADWYDRRVMFDKVYEEIYKLRESKLAPKAGDK